MSNDQQLKQPALDELNWEPSVNAAHIDVTAANGAVTLTGKVNTWSERELAASTAWAAPGVSSVTNDIRVR
jgi:osmotically-inducible protein OsmY